MKKKIKVFWSLVAIVIFMIGAMASFSGFPSGDKYDFDRCKSLFNIQYESLLTVLIIDGDTNMPLTGVKVTVTKINYQGKFIEENDRQVCRRRSEAVFDPIEYITDNSGTISLNLGTNVFENELDAVTVQVKVSKDDFYVDRWFYRDHKNTSPMDATIKVFSNDAL